MEKYRLKIIHKVFLFSLGLVTLVILGGIYINNNFLEEFYSKKRIEQLKEARELITENGVPTEEMIENYSHKYNITINIRGEISKSDQTFYQNQRRLNRKEMTMSYQNLKFDSNNEGNRINTHMGMKNLEYYKLLPTGELVILKISLDSIKSTVGIVNKFYLYTGLIILIGSLFFIYLFSLHITRPVLILNSIISRMVKMDFSHRADLKSGDELEELGTNINFLSLELEKNISSLKLSNIKLQDEVEKIKKIDELRKDFIGSITHEIKTPITVINTHAEMILYDMVENKKEEKEYLKTIISEGVNINDLLNKLLEIIKLEETIGDLKEEELNISNMIKDEINKYKIDIAEKKVELKLNLGDKVSVLGDRFQIRQVLTNIMSNAISYVDEGGKLDFNILDLGDNIAIEIINTGSTIPEDKLENIWKAFYRVEKSRNRKYGGVGLGLTIVSRILERHRSKYGVENLKNGVKFWFTLKKNIR